MEHEIAILKKKRHIDQLKIRMLQSTLKSYEQRERNQLEHVRRQTEIQEWPKRIYKLMTQRNQDEVNDRLRDKEIEELCAKYNVIYEPFYRMHDVPQRSHIGLFTTERQYYVCATKILDKLGRQASRERAKEMK